MHFSMIITGVRERGKTYWLSLRGLTAAVFLAATASRGLRGDTGSIGVIVAASSMFVAMILAISMSMVMVFQAGTNMLSLRPATRCTHGFERYIVARE